MLRIYDKYSTMLNRLWNLQSIGKKGNHNYAIVWLPIKSTNINFDVHRKNKVKTKSPLRNKPQNLIRNNYKKHF